MIIPPFIYEKEHKNDTLKELIKERNRLIREIKYFEKHKEELMSYETMMFPSPDLLYKVNLEYLIVICEYILDKINEQNSD